MSSDAYYFLKAVAFFLQVETKSPTDGLYDVYSTQASFTLAWLNSHGLREMESSYGRPAWGHTLLRSSFLFLGSKCILCACVSLSFLYAVTFTCLSISARPITDSILDINVHSVQCPRMETETPLACLTCGTACENYPFVLSISFTLILRNGVSVVHDGLCRPYATKAIVVGAAPDTWRAVGL